MKKTFAALGAAAIIAVAPASIGLIGNASFSEDVPVRVPSQATLLDDAGHAVPQSPHSGQAKAGDNHGHHDKTELGDDNGGRGETELGDDNGGRGTSDSGDDHGGHGHGSDD